MLGLLRRHQRWGTRQRRFGINVKSLAPAEKTRSHAHAHVHTHTRTHARTCPRRLTHARNTRTHAHTVLTISGIFRCVNMLFINATASSPFSSNCAAIAAHAGPENVLPVVSMVPTGPATLAAFNCAMNSLRLSLPTSYYVGGSGEEGGSCTGGSNGVCLKERLGIIPCGRWSQWQLFVCIYFRDVFLLFCPHCFSVSRYS